MVKVNTRQRVMILEFDPPYQGGSKPIVFLRRKLDIECCILRSTYKRMAIIMPDEMECNYTIALVVRDTGKRYIFTEIDRDGSTNSYRISKKQGKLLYSRYKISSEVYYGNEEFVRVDTYGFITPYQSKTINLSDNLPKQMIFILGEKKEYYDKVIINNDQWNNKKRYIIIGEDQPEFIIDPLIFNIDDYFIYGSFLSNGFIAVDPDGTLELCYEGDRCIDINEINRAKEENQNE